MFELHTHPEQANGTGFDDVAVALSDCINRSLRLIAQRDAIIDILMVENQKLRAAIKNVIAYEHCGECGKGCIAFFEEKPCAADSKPCEEVFTLLKLVWPEFVEQECKEFGGEVDNG